MTDPTRDETTFDDVSVIEITADACTIDVLATDDEHVSVRALDRVGESRMDAVHVTHAGGALRISVEAPRRRVGLRMRQDEVFVTVHAPANVPVEATVDAGSVRVGDRQANVTLGNDAGSIQVAQVTGRVELSTDAGTITCTDVDGPLSATADAGTIRVDGHGGGPLEVRVDAGTLSGTRLRSAVVHARSAVGSLRLAFEDAPTEVDATCDVGTVKLELPDAEYEFDVRSTGLGRASVSGFTSVAGAERRISVRTDVGSARVIAASMLTGAGAR